MGQSSDLTDNTCTDHHRRSGRHLVTCISGNCPARGGSGAGGGPGGSGLGVGAGPPTGRRCCAGATGSLSKEVVLFPDQ